MEPQDFEVLGKICTQPESPKHSKGPMAAHLQSLHAQKCIGAVVHAHQALTPRSAEALVCTSTEPRHQFATLRCLEAYLAPPNSMAAGACWLR